MKFFKGFVFAIIGLFIIVLFLSFLMPSRVVTIRSVNISQSQQKIFDEVVNLRNWRHWHPLFKRDSAIIELSDTAYGVNAYARWTSNKEMNTLKITNVSPNSIRFIVSRSGKNDIVNDLTFIEYKDNNSIQAEWVAFSRLKWYPWEKFSGMFIDKMTGPGYEAALNELKGYVENH